PRFVRTEAHRGAVAVARFVCARGRVYGRVKRTPTRRVAMMRRLSGKLTYANVVSTICLVLLLGGGAAYAASHLAKNSVGTKQLKKNSVTTEKIKKNAVTGAKVKKQSLTGEDINLAKLGTVPSAQLANSIPP